MLERVTIIIKQDGFVFEGKLTDGTVNVQQWGNGESSNASLLGGKQWSDMVFSGELLHAIDQATLAANRIVRHFTSGMYETINNIVIDIGAGRVDCQISGDKLKPALLHYEWDETAQLKPVEVVEGNKSEIPDAFLNDFHEASFGRIGLLARTMQKFNKVVEPIDDRGALRWA